jgi:hypothetical protein
MRWTRQRRARRGIAGRVFKKTRERCDGAQDERCIRVRRSRVVLASVADAKSAEARRPDRAWTSLIRGRRWQKEFVTGESAKQTVKTIACGNAGCFRSTCGDLLVCFHHSHARLRVHRHPAFPTPSMGESSCHASGTSRRGNAEAYPPCRRHSGARHFGASPESILPIVVVDSGPAPSGASRNDRGCRLPNRSSRSASEGWCPGWHRIGRLSH